ncbi:response regulator [Victivallis sp. Marseille-Q1083]|uniref:response regulator n=1 Tax=Victivallis sp. Marseille-Q1083 TaxID=2717288 RepID=UPI0015886DA9|nr:response regulator [Victivallis sp. Marseille-Q1083]
MAELINKLPGGTETILIVDDHETIWDFLIEALQELGYSVLLAENGLDAVEIYRGNPDEIDLVLLDMVMPKAGGHQTFYRIKEIDPDANILLSSGFVSEDEVQDLLKQGANGFLPKPHRLPAVAAAIRRILDQSRKPHARASAAATME